MAHLVFWTKPYLEKLMELESFFERRKTCISFYIIFISFALLLSVIFQCNLKALLPNLTVNYVLITIIYSETQHVRASILIVYL